jgi:hypothetical protein
LVILKSKEEKVQPIIQTREKEAWAVESHSNTPGFTADENECEEVKEHCLRHLPMGLSTSASFSISL